MIMIKDKRAIEKMQAAGQLLASIMEEAGKLVQPGASTLELDAVIEKKIKEKGMVSMTKGFRTYKHSSCISVNDEIVHGVPHEHKKLAEGDLVKIDICASYQGYAADMARCFFVGHPSEQAKHLVDTAYQALDKGIQAALPGRHLSDISAAIQQAVEGQGFGIVRIFAGHGIGKSMHEDPEILNYGKPGRGPILRPGMTLAIEPMITAGSYEVSIDKDGWTARTKDKSLAAHVEDTIVITESGPRILTRPGRI